MLTLTGLSLAVTPVSTSAAQLPGSSCGGWVSKRVPGTRSGPNALHGVAATSARNAWAVSYYRAGSYWTSRILHWNGTAWKPQPTPVPRGTDLYGVAAVSASAAWVAGYYYDYAAGHYKSIILHWGGHSWSRQATPNPAGADDHLYGVKAISARNAWAVGTSYAPPNVTSGRTLILHWNGHSWSRQVSPNARVPDTLNGVAATSPSNMWAVGYYEYAGQNRSLVIHWYRGAWYTPAPATGIGNSTLDGVAATSANVWAVGQSGSQNLALRHC